MGKRFDLISDPIRTAQTVRTYVVGDQWREAPYEEGTYQNRAAAVLIRSVNEKLAVGKGTRIYARASNQAGQGSSASRVFTRTIIAKSGNRYGEVAERVKW